MPFLYWLLRFSIEMASPHQIPVLQKALRVISAIAAGECEPTHRALSAALKIAPATCYRILQTFAHAGWVRALEGGGHELGMGLFPLLRGLQGEELLSQRMVDAINELTAATGVTSKVSARDGDESLTLLRADSPQPMSLAVRPGARFHMTLGASGAVLLSALPDSEIRRIIRDAPKECWQWQKPEDVWQRVAEMRREGVVADHGHYRPDVFGISTALLDAAGTMQGSLTLTGLLHGCSKTQLARFRKLLVRKAAELNRPIKARRSHENR